MCRKACFLKTRQHKIGLVEKNQNLTMIQQPIHLALVCELFLYTIENQMRATVLAS